MTEQETIAALEARIVELQQEVARWQNLAVESLALAKSLAPKPQPIAQPAPASAEPQGRVAPLLPGQTGASWPRTATLLEQAGHERPKVGTVEPMTPILRQQG